jgi:hypothetical protein
MIDLWLTAIENLILDAPGNTDSGAGPLWASTLARLGESKKETARTNRFFWDYFEASDVAPSRPFFILVEREAVWSKFSFEDLHCTGAVEVTYTERVANQVDDADPVATNAEHKSTKGDFAGCVGHLMESCAARRNTCDVQFAAIQMETPATRTPRNMRDPSDLDTDYWWTRWLFLIGETENP